VREGFAHVRTHTRVIVFSVLLLAVLLVGGSLWLPSRPAATDSRQASPTVQVTREKFTRSLIVSGELAAVRAVNVASPPFRGQGPFAIKALAPEGSRVEPGDLLVQIDNSIVVNNLTTEELNLEKADNDLSRKEAELDIQTKDLEIQVSQNKLQLEKSRLKAEIVRELLSLRDWQDNQFAFQKSKKEYEKTADSLGAARKAQKEELALLRVKRDQLAAKIDQMKSDIAALEIRAERPGTVLYDIFPPSQWSGDTPRKLQVGDQIFWGWNLLILPDLSEMEARVFVSEVDGGMVLPGQSVRLRADSFPDREFTGKVQHVPELAERIARKSKVRAFLASITLDKTDPELMRPGMSVQAEIVLDEREGLVLPRRAVREAAGRNYVLLADGRRLFVELRARNALACLVEGIAEGTEVRQ
jgi:HlyD family secretion protein